MTDATASCRDDGGLCFPVLLAGGRGSRLHELTRAEAKPALFFAGERRIVDFAMAGAVRAGLDRMLVATQFSPQTLNRHLPARWGRRFPGGLSLRDGNAVTGQSAGYAGTASAVAANAAEIGAAAPRDVLVLAGDHVCAADYRAMIRAHRQSGAKVTVAVGAVDLNQARAFGVFSTDAGGQIRRFTEKPPAPDAMPGDASRALVSLGFYVFDWDWLRDRVLADAADADSAHDFGHTILPMAVAEGVAQVWRPQDAGGAAFYWRDVGTLDAYRLAQLDFLVHPPCDLPDTGTGVENAMLGRARRRGGWVAPGAVIAASVVLPGATVAEGARLNATIVGPGAQVPRGLVAGEDPAEDARWFRVTAGGTVLITKRMLAHREAVRSPIRSAAAMRAAV